MPVELITDSLSIKPNHVLIILKNRDLHIQNGEFDLSPISNSGGWPNVITIFLRSVANYNVLKTKLIQAHLCL
jgi:two-component system chemotaxis response regulator CheB